MTESNPPSESDAERRVLQLVDDALELPAEDREAFLRSTCGDDVVLLQAATDLLRACERAEADDEFLGAPASAFADPIMREVDAADAAQVAGSAARVAAQLKGRYAMQREIGRGGNAVVYRARDEKHGRDVAIKIIRHDVAVDSQRARFAREVAIVAQLRHPYVVPLIDSGEADGVLYYVMPFIEGDSLRQRLDRQGALPVPEVLDIARDVAEALDMAHGQGIVHRDIKPQNILLSGQHALVADFGIALALEATGIERVTERGVSVGTPAYMSPEQASGNAIIDGRSDVYSLGCVVYEMLTGEVPYPGDTPRSVGAKHMHAPVPDLTILRPSLPPSVRSVMERALAKVPGDRYESAGAFVHELAEAIAGRQLPAATTTRPPVAARSRWMAGAAVAVAAIVLIALAVRSGRFGRPADDGRLGLGVMPFRPLDNASEWSEALPDLLATFLDGTPGVRVADPWALWRPLRASANAPAHSPDPSEAERLAKRAGVSRFVLGTVLRSGARLDLTVRIYDVGRDEPIATVRQNGSVDSTAQLAQRTAVDILKRIWTGDGGPRVPGLESVFTQSPDALKAYLAAREAMRRGLTDSADAAITHAITVDPTFALGLLDAVVIRTWAQSMRLTPYVGLRELAERALQHGDSLTERQRLRLTATMAMIDTDGPTAQRAWNALMARDSTDFAAAEGRAYAAMAYGWEFGATLPDMLREADRVVRLDSTYVPALFRVAQLLPATMDSNRVRRQMQQLRASGSSPLARAALVANTALLDTDREFATALDSLARSDFLDWTTVLRRLRSYRPDRALTLVRRTRELAPDGTPPALQSGALIGMLFAAGRLQELDSLWRAGDFPVEVQRGIARRTLVTATLGIDYPPLTQRALNLLWVGTPPVDPKAVAILPWQTPWILGAWNAMYGDTTLARRWQAILGQLAQGSLKIDWRGALASDIEGRIAERRGDSTAAGAAATRAYDKWIYHIDNALDDAPEVAFRVRYALALRTAGHPDSAIRILESLVPPTSWVGVYVASAHYTLGELFEKVGDQKKAAQSYDAALQLWELGDSSVAGMRTRAGEGLRRTARGKAVFRYGRN